ncbi:MAG TPA: peptidylprolyl isomerase [Opitutaceae bacterium]
MPIHLLIPHLRPLAAALALPLAAAGGDVPLPDGIYAQISTPRGDIVCVLDTGHAPLAVTSFVGLAEGALSPQRGKPFFDGLDFHRVVPGFVIQGGDPLGTGEGGPGYTFSDEFSPGVGHDAAGVLSMANDGPGTNGSQFFITLGPAERLDYMYTAFGRVVRGADVPRRVVQGDVMTVRILRVGAAARAFRADEVAFAAAAAQVRPYFGDRAPGPRAHFDDPDKLLPADPPRAEYLNYKLNNFQRATGLRVYARLFAAADPHAAGGQQGTVDRLSHTLGLGGDGLLAAYFADTGSWRFSAGTAMDPRYADLQVTGEKPGNNRALGAFMAGFTNRERKYESETPAALANFLQTPGQRIWLQASAMIDELMAKPPL